MRSYSIASGTLTLQHRDPKGPNVSALVDVQLVLERLGPEQTRIGEWVNVIGYITLISATTTGGASGRDESMVHVQALLLWSAGPLDVEQYRVSVELLQGRSQDVPANDTRRRIT